MMAMNSINPIKLQPILQLRQLGINENSIKYNNISIESDRCIVIREATKLSIVNTATRNVVSLNVNSVDSAIMNPSTNVLGLRCKNNLQIFNLSMKAKIKNIEINDNILYWRWLNERTIAYVTNKSVYHWSMESDLKPEKQFDIVPEERKIQCIAYDSSNDGNWLYLQGITRSQNNSIEGVLQLFNVPSHKYQPKMNAHGGCFAYLNINGRNGTLFCFTKKDANLTKLFIVEIGNNNNGNTLKIQREIKFLQENDFIISMVPSNKFGCIYALSQQGWLYIFDLSTGKQIYSRRVSNVCLFMAVSRSEENGGVMVCDRNGAVISITIDCDKYVSYIRNELNDNELAMQIAAKFNLCGAEDLFKARFGSLISSLQYEQAIRFAVNAPKEILRTPETIKILELAPNGSGGPPSDLKYYTLLLQKEGKLNEIESVGLCRRILNAKPNEGITKIEKFVKEKKLQCSEELGDLLVKYSPKLAASVYYLAKVPNKTILCFIKSGKSDKVIQYCSNENYIPNWSDLLGNVQKMDGEKCVLFAKQLIDKNYLKPMEIVNILLGFGRKDDIQKTTEFLLDYLNDRGDKLEDAELQTKIFEINLRSDPQVADALFDECSFSHFDKSYIAHLCEGCKLYHRALKLFDSLIDIKRVLHLGINTNILNKDFIISFFGGLTPEDALECLNDLLIYNENNTFLVVEIAQRYNDQLTTEKLINLFENNQCWMGLYSYLNANLINFTKDKNIIYKYIVAATKCNPPQFEEINNICFQNDYYDPQQIKTYLLDNCDKLLIKDPRCLIHVCDRYGYISDLIHYLYSNQMYKFIQIYTQKMNQSATPKVIATLIDLNCPEDQIKNLLNLVRPPQCSINELVFECEKKERLNLLLTWLEERIHEKLSDDDDNKALYTALAKIYVNINNNPHHFLIDNKSKYDHIAVGKFCESRDPRLAFIAYKESSNGECDKLLINIANKNGFYKDLARHCIERQDLDFWKYALNVNNDDDDDNKDDNKDDEKQQSIDHRRCLIDQVISVALTECRIPEQISMTVKAFMSANLPNELIELLERILLSNTNNNNYDNYNNFKNNENLQNLLLLTAIKANPSKIIGYIDNLNNYDAISIAKVCKQDNYKLFEEAFLIYKKFNYGVEAINVLLHNLNDLERGKEFANYFNESTVYSILGKSQLDNNMINESISSFLKANDAQYYQDVILAVNDNDNYNENLIKYLLMAKDNNRVRDKIIDSELIYLYAKINDLTSIDKFINDDELNTNNMNNILLNKIGDRLFNKSLFESAKIIFIKINNFSKLASCLIKLNEYSEAVDISRKANSTQTWKDVCFACIDAKKFKLASICGIHIIIFMDHLYDLIKYYSKNGYFVELIHLLEQGINLDRAHQGIYTELGVLYAKYCENKLMEYIQLFWNKLNIQTLLQICIDNQHWKEIIFLYIKYEQYDNAAEIMISHSSQCWQHDKFKSILMNICGGNNNEIYYKSINFYLNEHPLYLSELLIELTTKLDHIRVIHMIRRLTKNKLSLIRDYLLYIQQKYNISEINEALNELFIDEEDYKSLKQSISNFDKFDQIGLAQKLEKHQLLEFRKIAAMLYRMNKRYKQSIMLSKQDSLWQDTMDTAAVSNDYDLVEELLRFFVENIKTEKCPPSCFPACLFTCFDLIKIDIVLELSWKHNLFEYSMPFMIQAIRRFDDKFDSLNKKVNQLEQKLAADNINNNDWKNNIQPMMPMIGYMPQQQIQQNNNNNI